MAGIIIRRGAIIGGMLSLLATPAIFSQQFEWKGDVVMGSGTYTLSERTNTKAIVNTFAWTSPRFRLEVSIPFMDQDTPYVRFVGGMPSPTGRHDGMHPEPHDGGKMDHGGGHGGGGGGGGGPIEVPDPETLDFDQRGLGDPILRFDAVILGDLSLGRALGAWAAVKAPIAGTNSGFGTGEWDVGGGLAFAYNSGRTWYWAEAGYWLLGDPVDYELIDPFFLRLEFDHRIGPGAWSVGAAVDGSTETVDGAGGRSVVSANVKRHFMVGRRIEFKIGAGLTEASPDWIASFGWRVPLGH